MDSNIFNEHPNLILKTGKYNIHLEMTFLHISNFFENREKYFTKQMEISENNGKFIDFGTQ